MYVSVHIYIYIYIYIHEYIYLYFYIYYKNTYYKNPSASCPSGVTRRGLEGGAAGDEPPTPPLQGYLVHKKPPTP